MLLVTAWGVHRHGTRTLRCAFLALHNVSSAFDPRKDNLREHLPCLMFEENILSFNYVNVVESCH